MKPCGHDDRQPGCHLCTLYATDARYRSLWDGIPLKGVSAQQCIHLGTDRVRVHGSNRDWRQCGHPTQPLGPTVCQCRGCGPKCYGYTSSAD
jgi:hypothetical protein